MNDSTSIWIGIAGLLLITVSIAGLKIQGAQESQDYNFPVEPDLVMTMLNRTCYGFYNSEKDRGIKTINWLCDDGYITHDSTGVKIPEDEIYKGE